MIPQLISADEAQRAPAAAAGAPILWRILGLVRPYRSRLVLGILACVLFAGLQTASISAVFPVFKILLEEEGLSGWAVRTVAGHRLGVEFAPISDPDELRVARGGDAGGVMLAPGDQVTDPSGRLVIELLEDLSGARPGEPVAAVVTSPGGAPRAVEMSPQATEPPFALLRWGASRLPQMGPRGDLSALKYILGVMILVALLGNVFRYVGETMIARSILLALMDLRERLYERTLQLPMSFFAGKATADVVTRFVQDIQEIQRGLITLFGKAVREPIRAVFLLGFALLLDWRITATVAAIAPLIVLIFWAVGRSVKKANHKLLKAYGVMIDALTMSLQNLRVVKAYTGEAQEQQRLERVDRGMFRQQFKLARLDAMVGPVMETLGIFAGSVAAVWLASKVLSHELTPTKFMTLGVTLSALLDPLRKLTDVFVRVQRSTAGAERIFQVVDHPAESELNAAKYELEPLREAIEFAAVTFTYPGAERPALYDVSLVVRKGETIALVGPNGCGKTTLVSTLPRFFDPDAGVIRYDGVDLREATLPSLRRQIGLVSQEAVVFAGTPLENITYGAAHPDRTRAEGAAARAYADEFIRRMPGGYDADIGERGTTLSGGQRQRLAIARAIYRNAPILIFDEATSQIDSESELKIQRALREFARERTTIIIAHRLSTIQFASRIVVMDGGAIVDSGVHQELLERCLLYRNLCETQLSRDVT